RAEGDPLEGARIMLLGRSEGVASDELEMVRQGYLNAHPSAEAFVDFKDFSFFLIRATNIHLVAGFGRIVDLKPEQFVTPIADAHPLLEAEQGAIAHDNRYNSDAVTLSATKLLGAEGADWRCPGCDP